MFAPTSPDDSAPLPHLTTLRCGPYCIFSEVIQRAHPTEETTSKRKRAESHGSEKIITRLARPLGTKEGRAMWRPPVMRARGTSFLSFQLHGPALPSPLPPLSGKAVTRRVIWIGRDKGPRKARHSSYLCVLPRERPAVRRMDCTWPSGGPSVDQLVPLPAAVHLRIRGRRNRETDISTPLLLLGEIAPARGLTGRNCPMDPSRISLISMGGPRRSSALAEIGPELHRSLCSAPGNGKWGFLELQLLPKG